MGIKKKNIDNKYYLIEKILKKRIVKGKVQYFIKWLNYSERSNSWQPAENVKKLNPKKTSKDKKSFNDKRPVKILARFEENWCLVKLANGRTSSIQLTTKETYEIIVNGTVA